MHEFFFHLISPARMFFCTSPALPPISFLMVSPLEERFRLLKKSQLREDVRNSLQNRRFFQFRRAFLVFFRFKKAVFTGIKIEPTKSGIVSTVKSTRLHKRKRGIFSPLSPEINADKTFSDKCRSQSRCALTDACQIIFLILGLREN